MTRDNDPPARIYLQWVGDEEVGIGHGRPEGVTWCDDKIYRDDICYIRAGTKNAGIVAAWEQARLERDSWKNHAETVEAERDEWQRRAETAEAILANAFMSRDHVGGVDEP